VPLDLLSTLYLPNSTMYPNGPKPNPNRSNSSGGSTYIDMRGSYFSTAGRDIVSHHHTSTSPYSIHTGDVFQYHAAQPPPNSPPVSPTSPNYSSNSMPQQSGSISSQGDVYYHALQRQPDPPRSHCPSRLELFRCYAQRSTSFY
jgi:hypothetical protein